MPKNDDGTYQGPTNIVRSTWATAALEAYTRAVNGKPLGEYVEEHPDDPSMLAYPALDDLLSDLLHLVGPARMDDAMDHAYRNYGDESVRDYAAEIKEIST